MTTKREHVIYALEELGLLGNGIEITPEEVVSGIKRLDNMMAVWETYGIRVGYNFASTDADANSGVPQSADDVIGANLAVRFAPTFGKTLSVDTKIAASKGYDALILKFMTVPEMQYGRDLPRGAGNKPWREQGGVFFQEDTSRVDVGPDSELEFNP